MTTPLIVLKPMNYAHTMRCGAIANRPVKDIVDSHGNNLLIYPHSFRQSKDKIGSQSILSWQTNWKVTMFASD